MTDSSGLGSAEAMYKQRRDMFAQQAAEYGRHDGKLTAGRAITFLLSALGFLMAAFDDHLWLAWLIISLMLLAGFLTLAIYHDWLHRQKQRCGHLHRIARQQLDRCARRWDGLPEITVEVPSQHAPLARDLDLFGHCSLFQLLNLAHTPRGMAMLRDWLLEPAAPAALGARQEAVRELSPAWRLREELALRGQMLAAAIAGPEAFANWGESQPYLERHPGRKWVSRILTATTLLVIATFALQWLTPEIAGAALLVLLLANVLFSVLFAGQVQDIFNNISTRSGELQHYVQLFALLDQAPSKAARLESIRKRALRDEHGAIFQLKRLRMIMALANIRHASLVSILYFALQATVLWDFHVLWWLERWQTHCGHRVRGWFEALAEFEALASLSNLAFDNPNWAFADVDGTAYDRFQASQLGHPLLSASARVVNDVEVGPAGTVLLVTGSNMSGKSTLLRAIGLNAVLAQAGAPVCATTLRMPSLVVTTSMRIQDSLEDGVSFYMAELRRLKAIVDQASDFARRQDWQLLYLLDEILQGTNSVERHIAVSRVLAHLVTEQALGAVSTHDLDLAKSDDLSVACRPVHFRETLHGQQAAQQMTFDYKLRPGVATTTNALKLLELVGLG